VLFYNFSLYFILAGKASKNSQGVKNVIQNMRDDLDSRFSIG
jgi:hypothetical protein